MIFISAVYGWKKRNAPRLPVPVRCYFYAGISIASQRANKICSGTGHGSLSMRHVAGQTNECARKYAIEFKYCKYMSWHQCIAVAQEGCGTGGQGGQGDGGGVRCRDMRPLNAFCSCVR